MSSRWPKMILDPVHKIIEFNDRGSDHLALELINTKEFQRLRRIKQLGMSELVFPGANHSRFAHSIGVMHVARMFIQRFEAASGAPLAAEYQRSVIVAAALLHDVGHGPFSHAFENITGDNHEKRTTEIILDSSTEIHRVLLRVSKALPNHVASFFNPASPPPADIPGYYRHVISSQLDADRFDYLLRDTHATGTTYGDFDLKWLIQHLELELTPSARIYVGKKAFITAEAYVFARYHMYRTVYFHKTTRAAEVMLKLLFRRFKDLLKKAQSTGEHEEIVPGTSGVVREAFSSPMNLQQYLQLDDYNITEFMKQCEGANDPILRELGSGLANRQLYKAVDATGVKTENMLEFKEKAAELIKNKGLDPSFSLAVDDASDTPYKSLSYDPAKSHTNYG